MEFFTDEISPLYKRLVPHAYNNMVAYEDVAGACRVGKKPGKPFSGITTVMDFCAHSHRDRHNMEAGLTGVDTMAIYCGFPVIGLCRDALSLFHFNPDRETT